MRAKRSGQAAKIRRRRWGVVALVLAGLALCLLAALPVQAARNTKKYCFPLDTAVWRISDVYGKRIDPFTGKPAFHSGLDLACAEGTAVRAVQDGVVTAAAYSPSYGNHLRILHPDGCETRYAHLQYLYVRPGEVVQAGQTLGTVGQTGRATGAHLHLELWQQLAVGHQAVVAHGTAHGFGDGGVKRRGHHVFAGVAGGGGAAGQGGSDALGAVFILGGGLANGLDRGSGMVGLADQLGHFVELHLIHQVVPGVGLTILQGDGAVQRHADEVIQILGKNKLW